MKAYPDYKDSEYDWVESIPDGWNIVALKYLVFPKITDGPHVTPALVDDGIPFISAEAVQNGRINFDARRGNITREQHEIYARKCLPQRDDIFFVKSGATTGKLAYVNTDIEFGVWSPIAVIRAKKTKTYSKYLYQAIRSTYFQTQVQTSWSYGTQPNIGMRVIENLRIIIPPLPEQKTIADFLDRKTTKIDKLIEKKKRQVALLKEQRTALINQAVTKGLNPDVPMKDSGIDWLGEIPRHWNVVPMKWLVDVRDGTHDTPAYLEASKETIPFVTSKDFDGNNIDFSNVKYISQSEHQHFNERSKVDQGDVLMSMIGGNIGKALIVTGDREFSIKNVALLKTDRDISLSKYILYYIRSGLLNTQINIKSRGGAQSFLSLSDIRNLLFFKMPKQERKSITNYLDKRMSSIDISLKKLLNGIKLLQEYRTALISAAVTGKIDVR